MSKLKQEALPPSKSLKGHPRPHQLHPAPCLDSSLQAARPAGRAQGRTLNPTGCRQDPSQVSLLICPPLSAISHQSLSWGLRADQSPRSHRRGNPTGRHDLGPLSPGRAGDPAGGARSGHPSPGRVGGPCRRGTQATTQCIHSALLWKLSEPGSGWHTNWVQLSHAQSGCCSTASATPACMELPAHWEDGRKALTGPGTWARPPPPPPGVYGDVQLLRPCQEQVGGVHLEGTEL